jgi:hypothetical protein
MTQDALLSIYLNDHLAAATAGVALFRRAAESQKATADGPSLDALAREVDADRDALRLLMSRLSVKERRSKMASGWLAEKAGRLKPNGRLVRRSPLSDVLELELLRSAVAGKTAGWELLRHVADHDTRIRRSEVDSLLERAHDQSQRLQELHRQAVVAVVAPRAART